MASAQQEGVSQAVHVPSCLNDGCKEHMDRLVALLEERGVKCVYQARGDYGLGGLFADHFKHFFKSCRRTIIHICPQSLQMVKQVKDVFMSDPEKTSFFCIPCSPSSFPDDVDVHMFNVWNLSDESIRKTFVKEMANEMVPKIPTQQTPLSLDDVYINRETVFKPINIIHRGSEHPVVYLHESLLLTSNTEEYIRRIVLECTNQEQWSTLLNQTSPQDLFFILNKVLPELYKRRQIIHLVHFAGAQLPTFRNRALRFIQLLLLSHDPTPWSITDLKETEIAMFNMLSEEVTSQRDNMPVNTIVTYLMTLVSYIIACKAANKKKECEDHLGVIKNRQLFQAAELKKNRRKSVSETADLWINVLYLCISHWQEQKSKKRDSTYKQKTKQKWQMQLLVFISRIIQLNRNHPFDLRIFPSLEIIKQCRGKDSTRGLLDILVANVTICGLTALLEHRTTDLVCSSNFSEVCWEAVTRLIGALSSLHENDKLLMFEQLTTLLFHHNKHIRMQAPGLFILDDTYGSMTTILWERLKLTTQDLLYPLLQDNRNTQNSRDNEDEVRGGWTVVKHNFGADGRSVLTHVLRPSTHEHQNEVRCSLKDKRLNELRLVKDLQHPHLVQLRAFSDQCWPQFYITEDYLTTALQSILVNRSRNDNRFSLKKLLIFLIDALKGVQFLHENNIVHRDLTAANFFVTASEQVKLSGLMQARRPPGDTIRDFECSFIPTRWTAPESLQQCQFSKMSDMWMVGHLIYEVLTHGRLPYADVGPVDTELIPMVVAGRRTLCDEACIPDPVHSVITQLTNIEPSSRLSEVKAVIDVLHAFADEINEDMNNAKFPDIREEGQAATEHGKGPVISVLDTYFGGFKETLDETSDQGHDYINASIRHQRPVRGSLSIRELCPKDFSSDVWSVLTEGHLPGISPLISQPKMNSERQLEISFAIPAKYSICSLAQAVLRGWLGNDIQEYIECLGNIATAIAELHSRGLVLCDFCADTIFIEKVVTQTGQTRKVVWFASIVNIRSMQHHVNVSGQLIEVPPPKNSEALRRSAPEVVKQGLYSHASDVFCFGRLMWWVFNTFCRTATGEEGNKNPLDPLAEVDDSELYQRISDVGALALVERPPACPPAIYHLILKCWNPRRSKRPSIQVLQEHLTGVKDNRNPNESPECDYFEGHNVVELAIAYSDIETNNSEGDWDVEGLIQSEGDDDNFEGYTDIPEYLLHDILPESDSSGTNDSDEVYESVGPEPAIVSGTQRSLTPSTRPLYPLPPLHPQSVTQDRESHMARSESCSRSNTRSIRNQSFLRSGATGLKKGQSKRKIAGPHIALNLSSAERPLSLSLGEQNSFSAQKQQPASLREQKPSLKTKQHPSRLEPKLPQQSRSTLLAEQRAVSSPASPLSSTLPHPRHVAQISPHPQHPQSDSPPPIPPRRYAKYEPPDPVNLSLSAEAVISSPFSAPPLPPRQPSPVSSSTLQHSSPSPHESGVVVTSTTSNSLSSSPPPLPPRHSLRKPPCAPVKRQESNSPRTPSFDVSTATSSLCSSLQGPPLSRLVEQTCSTNPPDASRLSQVQSSSASSEVQFTSSPRQGPSPSTSHELPTTTSCLEVKFSSSSLESPTSSSSSETLSSSSYIDVPPLSHSDNRPTSCMFSDALPLCSSSEVLTSFGSPSLSSPEVSSSVEVPSQYTFVPVASGLSLPMSSLYIVPSQSLLRSVDPPSDTLLAQSPISTLPMASFTPKARSRPMPQPRTASSSRGQTPLLKVHPELCKCELFSQASLPADHREDCESSLADTESPYLSGEAKYTSTFTIQLKGTNIHFTNQHDDESTRKVSSSILFTAKEKTVALTHSNFTAFHTTEDPDNKATDDSVDKNTPVSKATEALDTTTQAIEAIDDLIYTNTQAIDAIDDPIYTNTQAIDAIDDPIYTNTQAVEAMDDPIYTNTQATEVRDDPLYTNAQASEGPFDPMYINTQVREAIEAVYTNTPGNQITDVQNYSGTPDSEAREDSLYTEDHFSQACETTLDDPVYAIIDDPAYDDCEVRIV